MPAIMFASNRSILDVGFDLAIPPEGFLLERDILANETLSEVPS